MFSFDNELKITTSSILFRNSGENVLFKAFSITALFDSSRFCVFDAVAKHKSDNININQIKELLDLHTSFLKN